MEQEMKNQPWNQIAEIELVYKSKVKASERPKVTTSKDAYVLFISTWDEGKIDIQEQFKILLLNRANRVLGIYQLSTGGITGTVVDPRLIFTAALKAGACGLILCHNHPSGGLKPSHADEQMTHKLKEAGRLLEINVLDHLIISAEAYLSFADEGLL